jgi:peptidyl-prolyl isomerase E (cyclophilin E)
MEEGNKTKKIVFVGGIGEDVNEEIILEAFSVFGVPIHQPCVLRG